MSRGSKSIPRAKLEDGFAEILRTLQPTAQLFERAKVMFKDAWNARLESVSSDQKEVKRQIQATEKQIESLLDRIMDAANRSVISAYETRLSKLEREKLVLIERAGAGVPAKGRLEECIELSLKFLANPWNIYENGQYLMRQTVFRLAFSEPLRYSRNEGYGTPKTSFPFRVLGEISSQKSEMVL
ncbi:hypothetical protein [Puniceibacterium sp. IMCC21224]|uniref:hypothetical protein n=1 Tax=Puniceibacterium sp. IMCC21224 TaxID=1618204 RepID=UPI00065DBC06|nr:hypothetical protein [Puniceibacterium sp. IMCC21224]KMK66016.1 hypothetical protein IMCC21224_11861 [Puniceibacterium sp. IMCC21224]